MYYSVPVLIAITMVDDCIISPPKSPIPSRLNSLAMAIAPKAHSDDAPAVLVCMYFHSIT